MNSITEYRPREANALADYFAGQASAWLLQKGSLRVPAVEPVAVQADPPYDLLLEANAVLLGPHREGKIVLILREQPGCSITQLGRFASWEEGKCAAKVKAIALATKKGSTMMSVEYVTPANDGRGRLYARQIGAQSLPRQLRLLIYGETHKEVDISGAHYELTRALCKIALAGQLPEFFPLQQWICAVKKSFLSQEVVTCATRAQWNEVCTMLQEVNTTEISLRSKNGTTLWTRASPCLPTPVDDAFPLQVLTPPLTREHAQMPEVIQIEATG